MNKLRLDYRVAEVTVETPEAEETPAERSAHEAAVAEGVTSVHSELAQEAASEAKAAAEAAIQVAESNLATVSQAEEAAAHAHETAAASAVSLELIHEQQRAMQQAIEALSAELRESRKASAPGEPPTRKSPDREPTQAGPRWVRR